MTVYEDKIQLNLRDYRDDEWVLENTYTIPLDPSTYPTGKVLDVTFDGEDASDKSGYENHGILKGSPEFVEGMNGGKAIHIVNSEKAKQYVDFGDIEQMQLEERLRGEYIFNEIRERLEYKARALEQETMVQRRLMKAFPGLRSKRFDKELQEMRAQMEARKRKRKQQKGERK